MFTNCKDASSFSLTNVGTYVNVITVDYSVMLNNNEINEGDMKM